MSILHENRKCFEAVSYQEIAKKFLSMNVLAWILLAFTLLKFKKERKLILIESLKSYIAQMNLYAGGCLQLMENAVFHSEKKRGAFSIRISNNAKGYLSKKYGGLNSENQESSFIEIVIADYAAENESGNIAQNFICKFKDSCLQTLFKEFTPVDFYRSNLAESRRKQIDKLWIAYYEKQENIGKHVGIRIFENVVTQSKGKFLMESHASHFAEKGESWRKIQGDSCMPGTSYMVVLPICELQKKLMHTEISIDKDSEIENFFKTGQRYVTEDQKLDDILIDYGTQKEKEEIILKFVEGIEEVCNISQLNIWYVSAEDWNSIQGELFCKAVLMARYRVPFMPHIVLYNSSIEMINSCIHTVYSVFLNTKDEAFIAREEFQLVFIQKDTFNELILIPENHEKTIRINEQLNFSRGIVPEWEELEGIQTKVPCEDSIIPIIPYDILRKVSSNGQYMTLFEHYAKAIIEKDIQEKAFGCKINDTHMRLGSTIHVDLFYEAELLFGNKLFISRFAYLIVSQLIKKIQRTDKITLYGYATYSELLVFEIMNMLSNYFGEDFDIDYAILEREMENRGDSHIDRIRYSTYFPLFSSHSIEKEERREHFKDRKIVCLVPIASTLKTNEKLIQLFCNENIELNKENIIGHYVLILVGSDQINNYWEINAENEVLTKKETWNEVPPQFFINVHLTYEEALRCRMCFPSNPLEEKPLIEVNAASTIPNQSFGLYDTYKEVYGEEITWDFIAKEEAELDYLAEALIYSHVKRGENHFLYYFQTEKMSVKYKKEIFIWLTELSSRISLKHNEYHVIFCPSHFSNAGFLECVNRIVFHDAAIIIRDDIDKEYRSNIMAKYSNIQLLFEKLEELSKDTKIIKFYYVDDSIITGRTFYRSKSLVESIADIYKDKYKNTEIHIFEKIFVLVDRNSDSSKMQYIECWKGHTEKTRNLDDNFYAFKTLCISSLRNHGDSCVICNIAAEANELFQTSSTRMMSEHWKYEKGKFEVKSLKKYLSEKKQKNAETLTSEKVDSYEDKDKRAYRRMLCTHLTQKLIGNDNHGNNKINSMKLILQLLLCDYKNRAEKERFEFFISYIKILSRPFIVFNKAVKQSVFDVLLIFTEYFINKVRIEDILHSILPNKKYLDLKDIRTLLYEVEVEILQTITESNSINSLLLVLLKQLTELKSNYIIRLENINKIYIYTETLNDIDKNDFCKRYLEFIKQLIGVSSDTSKSAWLDFALHNNREEDSEERITLKFPTEFIEQIYIENTRVYFDAIRKLFYSNVLQIDNRNCLSDYQFGNFKSILKDYQYMDNKDELNERGKVIIESSLSLLGMLTDDEKRKDEKEMGQDILTKCNTIANYIRDILQADCVKFVVEMDTEYDEWKTKIGTELNQLVDSYQLKEGKFKIPKLSIQIDKEYLLLANSKTDRSDSSNAQEFDKKTVARLKQYTKEIHSFGYKINCRENYLIWEMESHPARPVFLYAEFSPKTGYWDKLNNIRNTMAFYSLLNKKIFGYGNDRQLYELIIKGRDWQISNRSKTYTHTNEEIRRNQYEHVCNKEDYGKYYQSYVLMLLVDLKVSEIYRKSLKKEFYLETVSLKKLEWDNRTSIFKYDIPFYYFDASTPIPTWLKININNENIFGDNFLDSHDTILCYNTPEGGSEVYLLLYSLILNAGVKGRFKKDDTDEITVFLSKTAEGNLRISNVTGKETDIAEKINEDLKLPPAQEESGISLWSVSRYIKALIYAILDKQYQKLMQKGEACEKEDILCYQTCIENLLSDKFELRASYKEYQGENYFSMEVPILAEKYLCAQASADGSQE